MTVWLDAHLAPSLAPWMTGTFAEVEAYSVSFLGLRDASDSEIWDRARTANAIVMTKDSDFPKRLAQVGPPPYVLYLRMGNTSSEALKRVLEVRLPVALALFQSGESLVEIE